jgi:hypothetical protein
MPMEKAFHKTIIKQLSGIKRLHINEMQMLKTILGYAMNVVMALYKIYIQQKNGIKKRLIKEMKLQRIILGF